MPRPSQQGLYWEIPTITFLPTTAPTPGRGLPYSLTIGVSGGVGPYTITQSSGSLPTGVSFSQSGDVSAIISGTPTTTGSYTFTLKAVDYNGYVGTQTYSFSVNSPTITVLPASLPNTTAPATYSATITATGGTSPYTFDVLSGSLPTGLSITSAGVISGIANTPGTYNFVIRATDAGSNIGTQSYTVVIAAVDRAVAKQVTPPRVLTVYDRREYANGYVNYPINGGGDVDPRGLMASIQNRETSLGFSVTVINSYDELKAISTTELNKFSHIWDLGYKTPLTVDSAVPTLYSNYLKAGGAVFFLGENVGGFLPRDNSICSLINSISSGTASISSYYPPYSPGGLSESISPEFLIDNNSSTVTYYTPGFFSGYSTGTPISNGGPGASGVIWKTGSLSGAPAGAVVVVLDVNFLLDPTTGYGNYSGAQWDPYFARNLSLILNRK